ncbi:hypothetical protein ACLOJK_010060 [Asimina triloba]
MEKIDSGSGFDLVGFFFNDNQRHRNPSPAQQIPEQRLQIRWIDGRSHLGQAVQWRFLEGVGDCRRLRGSWMLLLFATRSGEEKIEIDFSISYRALWDGIELGKMHYKTVLCKRACRQNFYHVRLSVRSDDPGYFCRIRRFHCAFATFAD